jgi:subtilisin family serine protease
VLFKGADILQEKRTYEAADGEIIVVFEEVVEEREFRSFAAKYNTSAEVVKHIGDYALFYVKDTSEFSEILKKMSAEPQVLSAEASSDVNILNFSEDPFSEAQWYINNPGYYVNLSGVMMQEKNTLEGVDMDVVDAWETMAEAAVAEREVVVAVIDTGIDYSHPDLAENMWVNSGEIADDEIDNDGNGYIDDVYGWDFYNEDATVCHYTYSERYKKYIALTEDNDNHGTHIAGIIGAVANNNIGIAGVASNINIKIMALKINGGKSGEGDIPSAIEAIKYATMMGADICNLSWGTPVYSAGLEEIMKESDMLFVAAAGNSGDNNDAKPMYPANLELENLISVTFIDAYGEMTGYSNFGVESVDLAAPGDDIYSTVVGSYNSMSGSSMAAPQVSAVAAMLYAYHDHLYAANIKEIITSNIKPIPNLENRMSYGGIPSANQAVMASGKLTQDTKAPVLSFETIYKEGVMSVPMIVKDGGESQIRVVKYIYGEKTAQDFMRGVEGTTVVNNKVDLVKAGIYTFYAADYAGNETVQTYEVTEDTTPPKLTATYKVADDYKTRTVTIKASDKQSGLKRIKYMPGNKSIEDFLPAGAGTEVLLKDGKGAFKVKKDGIYTVYATDNRGNIVIKPIIIKTVKATELKLESNNKTMYIGEKYALRTYNKPSGSTDTITYKSSNEKVAVVTSTGRITALAEGTVYITARTSSGLTSVCVVTIKKT